VKCVADENVDSSIVRALRDSGHDVWYVAEEAIGIDDTEVLEKAATDKALLLTGDKDFGTLVFRQGRATAGVRLLRLVGLSTREKARLVATALLQHEDELTGAFSVLTPTTLRVRK
jgi:predicted nuclease of predicted toxin-antitoxin system